MRLRSVTDIIRGHIGIEGIITSQLPLGLRTIVSALLLIASLAGYSRANSPLPRDPSQLLLIGDSITAGIYFLSISEVSMRQAWSGQLVRRLGFDPPPAPYDFTYPVNHLGLVELGLTPGGFAYAWEARRAFIRGGPYFAAGDERIVLAVPAQTLNEMLTQSSRTGSYNKGSSGWTFANLFLPRGLTAIETVEQWQKRPAWIVLFIGSNDLLASFGIVGKAVPPTPDVFAAQYRELVDRLRRRMAPDAPANQFFVLTLPDVTQLPFLQPLPEGADDGEGGAYPPGSVASAFLVPFRAHYQADEVWTPAELDVIRERSWNYNAAIRRIAAADGLTVVPIDSIMTALHEDSLFSSPESHYFSPDLHHPSYRTHTIIADAVLDRMAALAGEAAPALDSRETPLPHSGDFLGKHHDRVAAMMHLALLGLASGPLPPNPSWRFGLETGGQVGDERIGDGVMSILAGVELAPFPVGTHPVLRLGLSLRATALALDGSEEEVAFFPQESLEARGGFGFERIAAWTWARVEGGALLTLDGDWDGGLYARGEWRWLYVETAGRGWWFDRVEAGVRLGGQPGRQGRHGN